ncbi:MAG TPA: hypothetical protein ENK19_01085 [Acidobacteria bacterium]|nr:hypothetical protein [Acidobacteriota bacterium]
MSRHRRCLRPPTLFLAGVLLLAPACRSTAPTTTATDWREGVASLDRPLPGNLAALYRLRSGSSGWLRLSVLTRAEAGRMTVSGGFGSALSLVAWDGGEVTVADLRRGCRVAAEDASAVLGLSRLPMPQAIEILAGRLPRSANSRLEPLGGGVFRVEGRGWSCRLQLAASPWRVVHVEGPAGPGRPRWRIDLERHTGSLPGRLEIDTASGKHVVLELVRLEWKSGNELPPLPALPECPEG